MPDNVRLSISDRTLSRVNGWFNDAKCTLPQYQRARFEVHATFSYAPSSPRFDADVTSFVDRVFSFNDSIATLKDGLIVGISPGSTDIIVEDYQKQRFDSVPIVVTSTPVDAIKLDVQIRGAIIIESEYTTPRPPLSSQTVFLTAQRELFFQGKIADVSIAALFGDGARMLVSRSEVIIESLNNSVVDVRESSDGAQVIAVDSGRGEFVNATWTTCNTTIAVGLGLVDVAINVNKPVFVEERYEKELPEDSPIGTTIATVQAKDADSGGAIHSDVQYRIVSGNDEKKFEISPSTGVVRTIASLDRETTDEYVLVIEATDQAQRDEEQQRLNQNETTTDASGSANGVDGATEISAPDQTRIYIRVLDVNDIVPKCHSDNEERVRIVKTLPVGSYVTTVNAVDGDSGSYGVVSYAITGGDENNRFAVNTSSGVVTVARNLTSSRTLVVEARDGGNLSSPCVVTIDVLGTDLLVMAPICEMTKDRFEEERDSFIGRLGDILGLKIVVTRSDVEENGW